MKSINKKLIKNISKIINNCTDCKKCIDNCEMLKQYCVSPQILMEKITLECSVDEIIPFSCTMCGKCKSICPKQIDLGDLFMQMRKQIVSNNSGFSPFIGHKLIHIHQNLGFSKAFSGLYISKSNIKENKIQRIFLPGCSLCAYSPNLVLKTYEYLNEKLPGTALLIQCCGRPTQVLAEEARFKEKYKILLKNLDKFGQIEIITACQSCFSTITNNSPEKKVKSLWPVLKEIGLPINSLNIGNKSDISFAIHDSCTTRYNVEIQDSIRWILNKLAYNIEESKNSGQNTICCGTGGMVHTVNKDLAYTIMKKAATDSKTNYFVTYCASCRQSITNGGKKAVHLLELIFGETFTTVSKFNTNTPSSIKDWENRYLIKRDAAKFLIKL